MIVVGRDVVNELYTVEKEPEPITCPECGMIDEHDERCPIYQQEMIERAEDSALPAESWDGGFADNH